MQGRTHPPLPGRTRGHARDLRQTSTDAERKLCYHLRGGRLDGLKFRRQHPIPPCIVDFYREASKLVVELDGSQHDEVVDRTGTAFLESRGLTILRYRDNDVLQQMEAVLEAILGAAGNRTLTPTPLTRKGTPSGSPEGEGL